MKKKKIIKIILGIIIMVYVISIVPKKFQNDTFFDIPIGRYILNNGIDMMDHFTWHTNLSYTYSHWLFNIVEYIIYSLYNFNGIYIAVVILSCFIGLTMFEIMNKKTKNIALAFIMTIFALWCARFTFTARAQIITYLLFILEYYFVEKLVTTNKKFYSVILIIIPIIIANVHASVWVVSFIFYLPYIAEFLLYRFFNIDKHKGEYKIIIENHNIKLLLITMFITIFTGLLTPLGNVPYIFMTGNLSGLSQQYIAELQPLTIITELGCCIFLVLFMFTVFFKNTKFKLVDLLYFFGLLTMSLMIYRSIWYFYLIGIFPLVSFLNEVFENYELTNKMNELFENYKIIITICIIMIIISTINIINMSGDDFIDSKQYPIEITKYILEDIDYKNMRIYNGFNYGSYLELNGIPAFMDSRSEVYCKEFNDTSILEDVMNLENGKVNYKEVFEEYNITHALVYKNSALNWSLLENTEYKLIYEEENFCFYEKIV